jgi:hypothetical protein
MAGIDLIAAERERQIVEEGFDTKHDYQHSQVTLEIAAHCYLLADGPESPMPPEWPWSPKWWKPKDKQRNLVRAGALYLAAADRVEHSRKDGLGIWRIEAKMFRDNAQSCGHIIDKLRG